MRTFATAGMVVWLAVAAAPPVAAASLEGIAGWEGDVVRAGYGFATVGVLIPSNDHLVFPVRLSGSYLYYRDESGATPVDVRAPGVALLAGIRSIRPGGSLTVMGGAETRWERRVPSLGGPGSTSDQTFGAVVQAELDAALSRRWRTFVLANYAGAAEYVYVRGHLRYQVSNPDWTAPTSFFVGIEGAGQGNDDTRSFQAGGFVESAFTAAATSLALHAGYKDSASPGASHHRSLYVGAGVYRRF